MVTCSKDLRETGPPGDTLRSDIRRTQGELSSTKCSIIYDSASLITWRPPSLLHHPGAADAAVGVFFTALPLIVSTGALKTGQQKSMVHAVSRPSEQLQEQGLQCWAVNNQHKRVVGDNLQTPTHLMLIGKHRLPDSK
ncbi:Hypothetical predicted protein [Scomber scombrus]|uniref:Uncharacterized protein n=1 Tax=Scomber scombrus TaxID=13677 RepID=A0AAV1NZ21_SCOSC